ncbi:MAG: 6-carboxytetrahydropterin synthase [Gammaproteobacteria bacterium]
MPRLFVEELTVIDCAFLDARRGLLGASWLVDLELEGDLDEQGMLFDFGDVKPAIKAVIDRTVDHKLLVPTGAPQLRIEQDPHETRLWFRTDHGELFHRSPAQALCLLDAPRIDTADVEKMLEQAARAEMPPNVNAVGLRLREEDIRGAAYRYVHGLRQHAGNCQRIAHGHRSRVQILRNGERWESQERLLAERWRDIYLGSRSDLAARTEHQGVACYQFRYRAPQGEFELLLPQSRCDLLQTESTVECIAEHIVAELKTEDPEALIEVRAYEGVRKGAIARAG